MASSTIKGNGTGGPVAPADVDKMSSTGSRVSTVQMTNSLRNTEGRRDGIQGRRASVSNPRGRTLLEEIEEAMAQSLLVFLVADFRLLSATGRVETKYETIAIASDPPTRSTAAELAGLDTDRYSGTKRSVKNQEEGLSPAQIMAVVMIELRKTVQRKRQREQEQERMGEAGLSNNLDKDDQWIGLSWRKDEKSDSLKLRADNDDMASLLRCYADMISRDLKVEPQRIEKRYSMLNLIRRRDSPAKQNEVVNVEEKNVEVKEGYVEADDVFETPRIGRAVGDFVARAAEETKLRAAETWEQMEQNMQKATERRRSLMKSMQTKSDEQFEELTDALFRQGEGSRNLHASLAQNLGRQNRHFTADELSAFVEKAVESRVYGKLDFLADFFKDGSVSKLTVESKARVVWMNDWYPLKDLTYAVAVNPEMKRVLVVFRGCSTINDWLKAVQGRNFRTAPNPIEEDYDGKTDTLNVAAGVYQYLFRVRKDTNTNKYDEIANIAYKFGKERIGDDFHLVVTGHSLGGALSTVFSFLVSADSRFTTDGPVKCFNFGSPYVGGKNFMLAFHHQEQKQCLMYARFFNHNDIVSYLPPNFQVTKEGAMFRPVGINVRVPSVPSGCCSCAFRRYWKPDVFYVKDEGFWRSYGRALRHNFLLKFPFPPWATKEMHKLDEMQERLMYGKLLGSGHNFDLLNKPIEDLYDMMVGTSYGTYNPPDDAFV